MRGAGAGLIGWGDVSRSEAAPKDSAPEVCGQALDLVVSRQNALRHRSAEPLFEITEQLECSHRVEPELGEWRLLFDLVREASGEFGNVLLQPMRDFSLVRDMAFVIRSHVLGRSPRPCTLRVLELAEACRWSFSAGLPVTRTPLRRPAPRMLR